MIYNITPNNYNYSEILNFCSTQNCATTFMKFLKRIEYKIRVYVMVVKYASIMFTDYVINFLKNSCEM